jgi:hypothetical protein
MVAAKLGYKFECNHPDDEDSIQVWNGASVIYFDPCNDPTDAWPIILESEISLDPRRRIKRLPWMAEGGCNQVYFCDKNPLRAAMIVYLMMQAN